MAEAIIKNDPEYLAWVQELSERYRRSQIKAAVSVNREMLLFYWRLGKDIILPSYEEIFKVLADSVGEGGNKGDAMT